MKNKLVKSCICVVSSIALLGYLNIMSFGSCGNAGEISEQGDEMLDFFGTNDTFGNLGSEYSECRFNSNCSSSFQSECGLNPNYLPSAPKEAISQMQNWCWVASGQMFLREKLIYEELLEDGEYIHEKFGPLCLEMVNDYYDNAEYTEGVEKNFKTIEEFEFLYETKVKHRMDGEGGKSEFSKEAAFLVYLSSDLLESDNPFQPFGYTGLCLFSDIVLKAAELLDFKTYFIYRQESLSDDIFATLVAQALSVSGNSVFTCTGAHFMLIKDVRQNGGSYEFLIQNTYGEEPMYVPVDSLKLSGVGFIGYEDTFTADENREILKESMMIEDVDDIFLFMQDVELTSWVVGENAEGIKCIPVDPAHYNVGFVIQCIDLEDGSISRDFDFIDHIAKKCSSVYQISKSEGVTIDDLRKYYSLMFTE